MKNRAALTLMEQLVMILVFALAAALCLRVFAAAGQLSEDSADRDRAMILAQNAAEALKAGGELQSETEVGDYLVTTDRLPLRIEGLAEAQIEVIRMEDGKELFSLTVAWQEVDGDG